ncbi:hypothetical protein YDYSG_39490 [Paenibacillus tyrfis]|uniref:adenosylcobinamide amidohydrolase n=1 Tax=Paenibacillus tyrfis TaxID=1501230 RepID=UPI00249264C9|nr:adenosylcobinamide amidohydrolase [Paenibacillus tyrfis]GLI07919.1 hypothetical protein YDYSG_39490 [Paenibacillus tyrfis]
MTPERPASRRYANELVYSDVPLAGVRFGFANRGYESYFLIESERPLRTLNSSMWGEGFGEYRRLMNRQVPKQYASDDPLAEMNAFMKEKELDPQNTAALLTAASLADFGNEHLRLPGGTDVCVWVTAGLSNKARAGQACDVSSLFPGTINTVVVIEGRLTDAAFVNAVITATEAKTAALQDLNIVLEEGGQTATGTTTDAILIAATQQGEAYRYAGTATRLGYAVGRTVYEATKRSAAQCLKRMGGLV